MMFCIYVSNRYLIFKFRVVVKVKRAYNRVYLIFMDLLNPVGSQSTLAESCDKFSRECQKTDSNVACCKNVVCNLQKASRFYMRDECKGPGGLATTACMDRDHDRLDRSCVKWMYQFYHVTKQSEGWRKSKVFRIRQQ